MREFRYLDYATTYSAEGDKYDRELERAACFSEAFRIAKGDVTYKIYIYRDIKACTKHRWSNYCKLSLNEIRHFVNLPKALYKYKIKVEEGEYERMSCFIVTLTVNCDSLFYKYLLTWIRYTYEFPYNMALYETLQLKKLPRFRFTSIANIMNCVKATLGYRYDGHSVAFGAPMTNKKLKRAIDVSQYLNEIYTKFKPQNKWENRDIPNGFKTIEESRNLEYWENMPTGRKLIYLHNFDLINK